MAGGPFRPFSAVPDGSGEIAQGMFVGGTNGRSVHGLRVAAAAGLTADRTWYLNFMMPPSIPTGTAKLRTLVLAAATTGDAKYNVKWALEDAEDVNDSTTLSAEGTTTVTWAAGDSGAWKESEVTLDASETIGAGDESRILTVDYVIEDTSYTLAVESIWNAFLVWE